MSNNKKNSVFTVFVNGELVEEYIEPQWNLSRFLRENLGITGCKIGCSVGGCGSCSVLISKYDSITNEFSHTTVNACITPLPSVVGCHVLTIEGLSDENSNKCHFIQDAIARGNGTQCGFCTPGFCMSMYGHLRNEENVSVQSIKTALQGNLCRCTGYRPILEAFSKCCDKLDGGCDSATLDIEEIGGLLPQIEGQRKISRLARIGFPQIEELLKTFADNNQEYMSSIRFTGSNIEWYRPSSLEQLVEYRKQNTTVNIIAGGTSKVQQAEISTDSFVDITKIPETRIKTLNENFLVLGSSLTIAEMVNEVKNYMKNLPVGKTRALKSIVYLMQYFGSQQIRNLATIGGSLMVKSDASDVQTLFEGLNVSANVIDLQEKPTESKNVLLPLEKSKVVLQVQIPLTKPNEFTWAHKVSKRKDCDQAIINAAFNVNISGDSNKKAIENVHLVFGGSAIKRFSIRFLHKDNPRLLNEAFVEDVRQEINVKCIQNIVTTEYSISYVCSVAKGIFEKFVKWLNLELETSNDGEEHSSTKGLEGTDTRFKSTQLYSLVQDGQLRTDLVGRAVPHASAYKHATGEAQFCDDTPKLRKELEMAFVLSTEAHAVIKKIDASKCLTLDGVIGFLSHLDMPKDQNTFGLVEKDEEIFASHEVLCVGQLVGAVVATSREIAKAASKLVEIEYVKKEPMILTNQDAIEHKSYFENYGMKLETGNCNDIFSKSEYVTSGEVTVGSAEHFYMEPQSCIAIPKEDGEMEIISSTQNLHYVQLECARILSVPANRIVVRTKRVGGGFGGKESRCMLVALPAAIAAKKFKRPVRCVLDRETDMMVSGKRHIFLTQHKLGYNSEGRLSALQMKLYINAGISLDVSMAAIERAVVNVDNAYNIPNVDLDGYVCKTNIPSNTVFRGTGGPQAVFLIENIMDHIAFVVDKDPVDVRRINMYKDGDTTPYGQTISNCTIQRCWDECLRLSNYSQRRQTEIFNFNRENSWKKRGIAVTPCNYGVGYTALHLNQGAALVHIYTDGSVLVSHSGVEIGQGVHSKMIQVATRELGIPASKIRILETATDKVPNATPSSASVTSDLSGMAVLNACKELSDRLEPYKAVNPQISWEEIVSKAYMDRVSLSATGFYSVPHMGWDTNRRGSPWNYFSTGAACSEVEVDCLTGQYQLLRTDIVMDVGESLNPAIDIGQIEGAFMQGVGLFTLEDLIMDNSGVLKTTGPNNYKIPTVGNAPLEFNVSLLSGSSNSRAIYSSKTVGEPPVLLAPSVFFAIKDAVRACRKAAGIEPINFHMDSPATIEKILLACKNL